MAALLGALKELGTNLLAINPAYAGAFAHGRSQADAAKRLGMCQ